MMWFQAAFDEEAIYGKQWVVLRMCFNGKYVMPVVVSRWPTQHEAEGHAKKNMAKLGQ